MASESPLAASTQPERVVVVGGGMVGFKFCQIMVSMGRDRGYQVTVVGEEAYPAYDRIHIADVLHGKDPRALFLAAPELYEQHGVDLRTGTPVVAVDRERRVVGLRSGEEIGYDHLVLATGSTAFVPPTPGFDLPGVLALRTLEDALEIKRSAKPGTEVVIIGGGVISLELAMALKEQKLEVHVVSMSPGLLPRNLDSIGASLLAANFERQGVKVHVLKKTKRVTRDEGGRLCLEFADGTRLKSDLVVISAGIRPRDDLAEACGLERGPLGGIVVDAKMRTSDPHIFAIGECALVEGRSYGLVAPGYEMARVAAGALLGIDIGFVDKPVALTLKVPGMDIAAIGTTVAEDHESIIYVSPSESGAYRKITLSKGKLVGAASVGPWGEFGRVQETVAKQRSVSRMNVWRFVRTGALWSAEPQPVAQWPEDAVVCGCMTVSRGKLSRAIAQGIKDPDALSMMTGAGTGCGSCKPLLRELLGAPTASASPADRRFGRALLAVAGVVGILAAAWALTPTPAYPTSVRAGWLPSQLQWTDHTTKIASGAAMALGAVIAGALAARKRSSWLQRFPVRAWQWVHLVLGPALIALTLAHTALRFGRGLNQGLAAAWIAALATGAALSVALARELKAASAVGKILRAVALTVHIAAVVVVGPLLGIHIFKIFFF